MIELLINIIFQVKNGRELDLSYEFFCNVRKRTRQALKAQKMRKRIETFGLIGSSNTFSKDWIIHQFYGNMSTEIFLVLSRQPIFLISKTKVFDEKEVYKFTH